VNKVMYVNIFHRLRVAVRRKCPEKRRTSRWFLLHNNAPAHQSVLGNDFLTENNVTTMGHPPHSPDLAPSDFYCSLNWNQQWRHGASGMLMTLRMWQKSWKGLHKMAARYVLKKLYSRWQKCIVAQGDYCKEHAA